MARLLVFAIGGKCLATAQRRYFLRRLASLRTDMRILLGLLATFVSTSAFAHTGQGDASGLMHGFMHPLSGLDHVLAMIAVGVLAVAAGGRALYSLPLAFMAAMFVGNILGVVGVHLPLVETGIGASIIVIAGLAALGFALPVHVCGVVVSFFGMFHGFAHGAEMPLDASGLSYAAGFLAATGLLHFVGIFGARTLGGNGRLPVRLAAGAIAFAGVAVLGGAI